jgi:hypothetical protein
VWPVEMISHKEGLALLAALNSDIMALRWKRYTCQPGATPRVAVGEDDQSPVRAKHGYVFEIK